MASTSKNKLKNKIRPSASLRTSDYIGLGFAKFDLKREKIKGFPEVILAEGKQLSHLIKIAEKAIEIQRII